MVAMVAMVAMICLASSGTSSLAHAQQPPIRTDDLGQGRYARMSGLVEKTIFAVDVFRVSMRFDQATAQDLERIVRSTGDEERRASRIADRAYRASNAYVRVVFARDIDFDQFVGGVRENLQKARTAGMIAGATYQTVSRDLPRWFAFLEKRGIREGDQLIYRAEKDQLRTVYLDKAGKTLLDQTDRGPQPSRTMLAGYFAPGTDSRQALVQSLFE